MTLWGTCSPVYIVLSPSKCAASLIPSRNLAMAMWMRSVALTFFSFVRVCASWRIGIQTGLCTNEKHTPLPRAIAPIENLAPFTGDKSNLRFRTLLDAYKFLAYVRHLPHICLDPCGRDVSLRRLKRRTSGIHKKKSLYTSQVWSSLVWSSLQYTLSLVWYKMSLV